MITLGNRRELMVDKFLVDTMDNLSHIQHRPTFANEAIAFDQPWEGNFCGYCTVIHDGGKYLLYYRGWPVGEGLDEKTREPKAADNCWICLAESSDGKTFTRAKIDKHEILGIKNNNVIIAEKEPSHNFSPFLDTRPGVDPSQRFKALANQKLPPDMVRSGGKSRSGLMAWASPDGVNWKRMTDKTVINQGAFDSQNVAFWSESEGCYVSYFRIYLKAGPQWIDFAGRRAVGRATSPDFINWSDTQLMEVDLADDEEFYTNQTHPYLRAPHIYIALPKRFVKGVCAITPEEIVKHKAISRYANDVSDGLFFSSRGGNRYDRIEHEAFMLPGTDPGNWVSRTNMAALGVVQTGDELSLYYQHGYSTGLHKLNRYTLRLDGFGSFHASGKPGAWTTKPLTFSGKRLSLNMRTSAIGFIKVGLLDEAGQPIPGFGVEDCDRLLGDRIDKTVTWKGSSDVSALAGKPVRLTFQMREADLFALKFEA